MDRKGPVRSCGLLASSKALQRVDLCAAVASPVLLHTSTAKKIIIPHALVAILCASMKPSCTSAASLCICMAASLSRIARKMKEVSNGKHSGVILQSACLREAKQSVERPTFALAASLAQRAQGAEAPPEAFADVLCYVSHSADLSLHTIKRLVPLVVGWHALLAGTTLTLRKHEVANTSTNDVHNLPHRQKQQNSTRSPSKGDAESGNRSRTFYLACSTPVGLVTSCPPKLMRWCSPVP